MSYSNRDLYYSETVINEGSIEEDLQEIEVLSSLLLLEDSKQVPHAKREKLCDALLNVPSFSAASHLLYSTDMHSAAEIDSKGIVQCIWSSMTNNVINLVLQYFEFYHHYPEEILLLVDGPKTIANISNLIKIKLYEREITDLYFIDENLILESKSLFKKLPDARHESSMSSPRNEHNNADGTFGIGSKIILKQQAIVRGDSHSAMIAAASNLAKSARDKYMRGLATKHTNYLWENNVGYGTKKHLEAIQTHGMTSEHRRSFLGNWMPITTH
jgi:ribonuclease HII